MADLRDAFGKHGFPLGAYLDGAQQGEVEAVFNTWEHFAQLIETGQLNDVDAPVLVKALRDIGRGVDPRHAFMPESIRHLGLKTGNKRKFDRDLKLEAFVEERLAKGDSKTVAVSKAQKKFKIGAPESVYRILRNLDKARHADE